MDILIRSVLVYNRDYNCVFFYFNSSHQAVRNWMLLSMKWREDDLLHDTCNKITCLQGEKVMCWLDVCVCRCARYWFSLCCSSYRPNEKVSYIFPDFASCESGDYLRCSCFNHVWCKNYLLKSTVKHYLLSWSSFYESIFKYGFGFSVFFQLFISQFQLWVFGEDFTFTWWWLFCSTMYMLEFLQSGLQTFYCEFFEQGVWVRY